jgi:hypothetical protein
MKSGEGVHWQAQISSAFEGEIRDSLPRLLLFQGANVHRRFAIAGASLDEHATTKSECAFKSDFVLRNSRSKLFAALRLGALALKFEAITKTPALKSNSGATLLSVFLRPDESALTQRKGAETQRKTMNENEIR